jgi:ubiquinone/menaquinone biosynthesis C-methylase UbiE
MKLMYGPNDHAYLLRLKEGERHTFNLNYPKFNHQGFQLEFFKKYDYKQYGNTLLDIGCGSGFYMNYAKTFGFTCYGIEFNENFAKLLRAKTDLDIYSFEEFQILFPQGKQFDVIHMGHVLEHSTDPRQFIESIKRYAHAGTVFVFDGPLEKNKCLSRFMIKCGSVLQRNKSNTYPPQHITFTNYRSQLDFFRRSGLMPVNYEVREQIFPLPDKFEFKHPLRSALFLMSRLSILISGLNPKWGNVFHFAGRSN